MEIDRNQDRNTLTSRLQKYRELQLENFGVADGPVNLTARQMNPSRSREFTPVDVRQLAEDAKGKIKSGNSEEKVLDAIAGVYGNNVADMVMRKLSEPRTERAAHNLAADQSYEDPESGETTEVISVDEERAVLKDEFGEMDIPIDEAMNVLAKWTLKGQEEFVPTPDVVTDDAGLEVEDIGGEGGDDVVVEEFKPGPGPIPTPPTDGEEEDEDELSMDDLVLTIRDLTEEIQELSVKFDDLLEDERTEDEDTEEGTDVEEAAAASDGDTDKAEKDEKTDNHVQEMKEELEDVESVSAEEFGVAPQTTMYGQHSQQSTNRRSSMDLRQARKNRLASVGEGSSDMAEEYGIAVSDKKKYNKFVPPPYVNESGLKSRNKKDLANLPDMWQVKAESLSVKFHPRTAESPEAWVVYDGSTKEKIPLFAVYSKEGQEGEQFATRDFGKELLKQLVTNGPQALEDYQSTKLADPTPGAEGIQPAAEGGEEPAAPQASSEDTLARFKRALSVALDAQNKNMLDSPLKDAAYNVLSELGIDNPVPVVEKIFQAAPAQFEAALRQANHYFGMDDKSFIEVASMVKDTPTVDVSLAADTGSSRTASQSVELERAQSMLGSVPLQTITESQNGSRRASISGALPKPKLWNQVN